LVEHDLAKVGVAGSSPVFRSLKEYPADAGFFFRMPIEAWNFEIHNSVFLVLHSIFIRPGGGIGRHAGLKILWPAMAVTVQVRSGAR
jgi:hypothetical protein